MPGKKPAIWMAHGIVSKEELNIVFHTEKLQIYKNMWFTNEDVLYPKLF